MHCVCIVGLCRKSLLTSGAYPPSQSFSFSSFCLLLPFLLSRPSSFSFFSCPPTHAEVAQWRANRILTPAKRGRKPGSGKKNIVKAASGKPAYVNLDMSQYSVGTVLLQVREVLCVGSNMGKTLVIMMLISVEKLWVLAWGRPW